MLHLDTPLSLAILSESWGIWEQNTVSHPKKGEKSLTSKYGLVPEFPDILHYEKAIFTDFITSLIFEISWLLAEKSLFE